MASAASPTCRLLGGSMPVGPSPTVYESYAPRSMEQRSRLARIAALTAGPTSIAASAVDVVANGDGEDDGGPGGTFLLRAMAPPPAPTPTYANGSRLHSASSSLPDATLSRACHASDHLARTLKRAASLRLALRASINIADDVSRRHGDLLRQSGELSAAAERLQAEADVLSRHAEEIGVPLRHYDAVDRIGILVGVLFRDGGKTVVRGLAKLRVDSDAFESTLDEIDDALDYFERESGVGKEEALEGWKTTSSSSSLSNKSLRRGRGNAGVDGDKGENAHGDGGGKRGKDDDTGLRSGSLEYYRRALALHDAALDLLREAVADRIAQTVKDVASALDLNRRGVVVAADKLEASLVYTRFHGISVRSNALISIAKARSDRRVGSSLSSYAELLDACRAAYCGGRETLLLGTVRAHMDTLREKHGLVGMTRLASVFLIRLCTVETALYLDFFGDKKKKTEVGKGGGDDDDVNKDGDAKDDTKSEEEEKKGKEEGREATSMQKTRSRPKMMNATAKKAPNTSSSSSNYGSFSGPHSQQQYHHPNQHADLASDPTFRDAPFQSYLSNLCSSLHRTVRRGLVSVYDLDTLCQVVSVLREERSLADAGPVTAAAARAIGAVVVDAQERLIFCANVQLQREVVRFKAGPDDLDYPGKLMPRTSEKGKDGSGIVAGGETSGSRSGSGGGGSSDDDAIRAQLRVYESWFPPMRSVLRILSKIFRVVEPRVFEDIALQSVSSVTRSLKEGSAYIQKKSGTVHADLFLVKHLLILREQLSPFDIQLRSVERQLDFSEAGKAVSRFLANRNRRLFSLSTENALVALLREGVSVQESSVDSKRDLDDALRSACNDFIEHTSTDLCGPVLLWVEKCKGAAASSSSSSSSSSSLRLAGSNQTNPPFMEARHVASLTKETADSLPERLEEMSTRMGLYLENPATQSILLKPVIRKIVRALDDARRFVGEVVDGESGWDAETRTAVLESLRTNEGLVKSAASRQTTRQ